MRRCLQVDAWLVGCMSPRLQRGLAHCGSLARPVQLFFSLPASQTEVVLPPLMGRQLFQAAADGSIGAHA